MLRELGRRRELCAYTQACRDRQGQARTLLRTSPSHPPLSCHVSVASLMERDIEGEGGREGEREQRLALLLHNHGPFHSKNPAHEISIATTTIPQT